MLIVEQHEAVKIFLPNIFLSFAAKMRKIYSILRKIYKICLLLISYLVKVPNADIKSVRRQREVMPLCFPQYFCVLSLNNLLFSENVQ
jgi:hypothetical protein